VRILANYGAAERDRHLVRGLNSRLDPIQAAVLATKLRHLDGWNERRRKLAARYCRGLQDIADLALPAVRKWALPVWHVFAVRIRGGRRDALQRHLAAKGIGTNVHYPSPIHLQPAYRGKAPPRGAFPVSERLADETLSLPLDSFHSEAEIDAVIDGVQAFLRCR
jgi:dTDP-3-amino-3,4,6-trideoxy-alpha-D-glucose transaminase